MHYENRDCESAILTAWFRSPNRGSGRKLGLLKRNAQRLGSHGRCARLSHNAMYFDISTVFTRAAGYILLFGAVSLDLLLARLALAEWHQQDVLLVKRRQEIGPSAQM